MHWCCYHILKSSKLSNPQLHVLHNPELPRRQNVTSRQAAVTFVHKTKKKIAISGNRENYEK